MHTAAPFFSIISVARNDAWPLSKTMRSVVQQSCRDLEYVVVDGGSSDGTASLVDFWHARGQVDRFVSEPDQGVYDAMNKGLRLARGRFVCFLNAGDVFRGAEVLAEVKAILEDDRLDGVLGWGELAGQYWVTWAESPAYKLSSLGFCHQSLFARREQLLRCAFDDRPGRTDSDTLQMARLYEMGARIPVVPAVWATRGGEPGISSNLERTRASITQTLVEEYPELTPADADLLIAFRRRAERLDEVLALLGRAAPALREHLALMLLDTLLLRQTRDLPQLQVDAAYDAAVGVLDESGLAGGSTAALRRLCLAQSRKRDWLQDRARTQSDLRAEISRFSEGEAVRRARVAADVPVPTLPARDFIVSMTSFPARIPTLHFVIRSLLDQTCRPSEIHLWLGEDEIPSRKWLPRALLDLEAEGLRVNFIPRSRYQYNKFLHNAAANRDRPIIIVDDDLIYPHRSFERLFEQHDRHPGVIIANRCHAMAVDASTGELLPYNDWQREVQFEVPSLAAFPTGVGGVLYPPGFLCDDMVTAMEDILLTAPYADDVWLKACALAKGVRAISTPLSQGSSWFVRYTPTMRLGALQATNVDLGMNDLQVRRCEEWLTRRRPTWRDELLAEIRGR